MGRWGGAYQCPLLDGQRRHLDRCEAVGVGGSSSGAGGSQAARRDGGASPGRELALDLLEPLIRLLLLRALELLRERAHELRLLPLELAAGGGETRVVSANDKQSLSGISTVLQ